MSEVRAFGAALVVLLIAAYVSWTHEDERADTSEVTIWDYSLEQLERVELVTTTQTVAMSYETYGDQRYEWFEIANEKERRGFIANEKGKGLMERFAPFRALRSLGRDLEDEELEETGLDAPKRKLTITANGKTRIYDLGKRTHGALDHYVRPRSSDEIFLVSARAIGDFEFPESKYMLRRTRVKPLTEIGGVVLRARGKTIRATQKNRQQRTEAFWVLEGQEQPNETIGNFLLKLNRISVDRYPLDLSAFAAAEPVLEVDWLDDDGEKLGSVTVFSRGDGQAAELFVQSDATGRAVIPRQSPVRRLLEDLDTLLTQ